MKSALITGVSGNLGSRMAVHLLDQGFRVAGLDIRDPGELGGSGSASSFDFQQCDLRSPAEIESAVSDVVERAGAMDVVINNAGIMYSAPLLRFEDGKLVKHDYGQWAEVIEVTLSAAFLVSACCARAMVGKARKGVILNISSICAVGNLGQPAYSAAKAGINGLTVALAKELGPLGIRVAALAPGYLDTESTHNAVEDGVLRHIRKETPTRKLGKVEEFLSAVDFIISNPYFNGRVLKLDGGLSL